MRQLLKQGPNLFLSGFHLATPGRKPRSAHLKLADKLAEVQRKSISQLAKYIADFIHKNTLEPQCSGAQGNNRGQTTINDLISRLSGRNIQAMGGGGSYATQSQTRLSPIALIVSSLKKDR